MQQARVDIPAPVASHDQAHKHGRPEHSANRAGWYILRCGAGLDFPAEEALRESGWDVFLARERKWRPSVARRRPVETVYPRFPGYLFVAIVPPRWPALAQWPLSAYMRGILAMGGRPTPLASGELERLQAEDGRQAPPTPMHRAFVPGQPVRVTRGAFREYSAVLDAIDENGAHITVQLLGRPASVPLPLTWLEAA